MSSAIRLPISTVAKKCCDVNTLITQFTRCMSAKKKYVIPFRMEIQGLDANNYTHKPIPYPKSGGRGVDGKVENRRQSGGKKIKYHMIDGTRPINKDDPETPVSEMVLNVKEDAFRTAHIALVANGDQKRWIICPEGAKKGSIIQSYGHIPINPVQAKKGDAYRLGALPLGTVIHNVEREPDKGGEIARAAGTAAVLMRKLDDTCVVQMPSGEEIILDINCLATVGKASNDGYINKHIGSPNNMRWYGIKQRSGLRKKKMGYNGKKMKTITPAIRFDQSSQETQELFEN